MVLKTENFFKSQIISSKISVFLAISFSVLIMGVLGVGILNYNSLGNTLKENISFNLILNDDVQELEAQQLIKSLNLSPNIKSVKFISREESASQLIHSLGQNFIDILGHNPLSNVIEINFFAQYLEGINIQKEQEKFQLYEEIDNVIYDQTLLFLLENNFKKIGILLLSVSILFFIIAFLLINSNIRLTIYSKRFSLKTMQLVGATKKFIQKPFLIANFQTTVVACILGNIILILLLLFTIDHIPEIKALMSINQLVGVILMTSCINLLISFFSTWICVRKYLNLNTEDLYQ